MKKRILLITTNAMLVAILLLMGLIPQLGFITINPAVSFTIMHLPVLVGAYLFGWRGGTFYGFLFGFISFYQASSNPGGILDPFFQNPIISVLPRLIFGFISGLSFEVIRRLVKQPLTNRLILGIMGGLLAVVHTVLTLGILGLLNGQEVLNLLAGLEVVLDNYFAFIALILTLNGVWEALIAFLLLPILATAVSKVQAIRTIMND
jgi:uncharacterized membrane protein